MKFKHHIFYRALSCFLLTALLLTVAVPFAWAEEGDEGEEEEVYIPEEYYEPVQSNAVAGWPGRISLFQELRPAAVPGFDHEDHDVSSDLGKCGSGRGYDLFSHRV